MTDLEKRAHDLALVFLTEYLRKNPIEVDLDESFYSNFVDNYEKTYAGMLSALEQKKK